MANWYISREHAKHALELKTNINHRRLDRLIEAASRFIDRWTRRFFIPKTETRLYPWPRYQPAQGHILWLDQGLISVTTLQTKAQDSSPTTISSSDYFLEPNNQGPPYNRIEIDLSSTSVYESGDTTQRSISVEGIWGHENETEDAGTVSSGLASSASATSMVCSDASAIDVGDTLLIESERVFVKDRSFAALGSVLIDGALDDDISENVTADAGHGIVAGETIRVDDEEMYVWDVSGTTLYVTRAYNGTQLASHSDDTAIHINRTLTIERGVNGTTAATHANSTSISRYVVSHDIQTWCLAEVANAYHQESSGWGRTIGGGEAERELRGTALVNLRKQMVGEYGRIRMGVA